MENTVKILLISLISILLSSCNDEFEGKGELSDVVTTEFKFEIENRSKTKVDVFIRSGYECVEDCGPYDPNAKDPKPAIYNFDERGAFVGSVSSSGRRVYEPGLNGKTKRKIDFISSNEVLVFEIPFEVSKGGIAVQFTGEKEDEHIISNGGTLFVTCRGGGTLLDTCTGGEKIYRYLIDIHAILTKSSGSRDHVVGHVCPPNPNGPPGSCG